MTLEPKKTARYLEDLPSVNRGISGVATSITALIGAARRGPVNKAVGVASFAAFEGRFGSLSTRFELGYAVRQFFLNGGTDAVVVRTRPPASTTRLIPAFRALDSIDGLNLLALPGAFEPATLRAASEYCARRRAFLIADAPGAARTAQSMLELTERRDWMRSPDAAIYFPWVLLPDPANGNQPRLCAPSGTMAGLYARTDNALGVWKPPAGNRATLTAVAGLAAVLSDAEVGALNQRGVNCLRELPTGRVAWGARTTAGDERIASEWKYVPVRRLALFIEESVRRGTRWAVFEPNDEPLWARLRLTIGAFLNSLHRRGAFQGAQSNAAYFVKCDRSTTTSTDQLGGIVNIEIGFAPLKPAEFVVIRLQQMALEAAKPKPGRRGRPRAGR